MDNAPRWDAAMARIQPGEIQYRRVDNTLVNPDHRPTRYDYDRYFYIVNERARLGFRPPALATEPLLITDVAIAAMLCRAEADLAWLEHALGMAPGNALARRAKIVAALDGPLWDAERNCYRDLDLRSGQPVRVEHIANYLPLYAGVVSPDRARLMLGRLEDPAAYGAPWPVPTVPPSDPAFESQRYWRGPTWINVNWLLVIGLGAAGLDDAAAHLASRTIELVAHSGFREYFDPLTGEGCGADDFAWTASLVIDLLANS